MTLIFGLLVVADGMELVVISVLYMALKQEWGLTEVEEGYLAGVVFVGVLFGNLVGGYLGDSWGRRKTLLASGLFFIASAAASALSPNVWVLGFLRALVGFAIGAKIPGENRQLRWCMRCHIVPRHAFHAIVGQRIVSLKSSQTLKPPSLKP